VKRSGRDETIWVVIYLCMEAMLGISLHSYPYLKRAKTLLSFFLLLISTLQQNWRKEQNMFCLEVRGGWWGEEGVGGRGRNDPNNVCTYE
jgi:hypothetical protein